MGNKKSSNSVERRLSNKELDRELSKVVFRNKNQQEIFNQIKETTWFRQYAKGSMDAKNKIIKKVKAGIRHGKFTYASKQLDEESRGFIESRKKKKSTGQKKLEKTQKKIQSEQTQKKKKVSRKQREQIKIQERKAPSGRVYSKTEIHEGVKSKRAKEWRKKNNIEEKDYE
jgi:hypothetical protein